MNFHLLIFSFITASWSFSLYFYGNPFLFDAVFWLKTAFSLTFLAVISLFCLIISVSKKSLKKFKVPLIVFSVLTVIGISILFTNNASIKSYLTSLYPQSTMFFLLLFVYGILGTAILFERTLKNSLRDHLQSMYLLLGFGIFLIAVTFSYVFLPFIEGLKKYFWFGPLFTIVFVLFFISGYYLTKKIGEESEKRQEAEKIAEEWEKLSQAKDQFLLSLQHHLRTPLTPFKMYLERILDGTYGQEENPVIKEKLLEMEKLANTLYSLMESLLDVQEFKVGGRALNLEDCQVENLIKSIVEELKIQAEQKGLYLKYEPPAEPVPMIKINKERIREAIWNLVDNAIKYTKKGGIVIGLKKEDRKLKIRVSDTGIGMEKKEVDYFLRGQLFERGEEAKKLYGPGRGIGLSIAIEFVKAHGGKIWAESKGPGKGTTFWIEISI